MKTKAFFLCLGLALLGFSAKAQQDSPNRLNVDYSFTLHQHMLQLVEGRPSIPKHINQNAVNISYGHILPHNFEFGIYCRMLFSEYNVYGEEGTLSDHIIPAAGIMLKYHLLQPMQINSECFDVAISSSVGGTFANGSQLEYGVGLCVSYFPLKHFGIDAEGRFGHFGVDRFGTASEGYFQANVGLAWRW